jgi:hypothetical protein
MGTGWIMAAAVVIFLSIEEKKSATKMEAVLPIRFQEHVQVKDPPPDSRRSRRDLEGREERG